MKIYIICSNCGKHVDKEKDRYGKLGDAFYCGECIDTWKNRNNEKFSGRMINAKDS